MYRPRSGILEISFSELKDLLIDAGSLKSQETLLNERNLLAAEVMRSLGPGGPGLLGVRGVPAVDILRKQLLPLAKKLALMPDFIRRPILKDHGLSTDVSMKRSDRPVSAFATQLQYVRHSHAEDGSCLLPRFSKSSPGCLCDVLNCKDVSKGRENLASGGSDLEQLGNIFQELGACMVEVGLLVARLCDFAISGAGLEDAIWESGSVKARLIHYHAYTEKDVLSYPTKMDDTSKRKGLICKVSPAARPFQDRIDSSLQTVTSPSNSCNAPNNVKGNLEKLWQQWHYDYGLLTVLTAPMFLSSSSDSRPKCEAYSGGHTGLRILSSGMDDFVTIPSDCLIVQVGEAAQIASGGKLAATAHCVCRPTSGQVDISRETFVTFLQPAWHRVLSPPEGMTRADVINPKPSHLSMTMDGEDRHLRVRREDTSSSIKGSHKGDLEGEECGGVTGAEVQNLKPLDQAPDCLSQTKEGKEHMGLARTKVLRAQFQATCTVEDCQHCQQTANSQENSGHPQEGLASAGQLSEQYAKLIGVVPSLDSRWKDGCTFAEFSRETTGQYYGAQGRQSQKTGHSWMKRRETLQ